MTWDFTFLHFKGKTMAIVMKRWSCLLPQNTFWRLYLYKALTVETLNCGRNNILGEWYTMKSRYPHNGLFDTSSGILLSLFDSKTNITVNLHGGSQTIYNVDYWQFYVKYWILCLWGNSKNSAFSWKLLIILCFLYWITVLFKSNLLNSVDLNLVLTPLYMFKHGLILFYKGLW